VGKRNDRFQTTGDKAMSSTLPYWPLAIAGFVFLPTVGVLLLILFFRRKEAGFLFLSLGVAFMPFLGSFLTSMIMRQFFSGKSGVYGVFFAFRLLYFTLSVIGCLLLLKKKPASQMNSVDGMIAPPPLPSQNLYSPSTQPNET
jgi:hypothetical protein